MTEPRISPDALAAFLVFVEHMNLTNAAAELHTTQPALHAKLGNLSRELGPPLYEKVGRRLILTPAGERIAQYARDQRDLTATLLDDLRGTPTSQPIVMAAGYSASLHVLGDVIRTARAKQPGGLRLMHTNRGEMLDAVRYSRAHLGVSVLGVLPTDLVTEPIATYRQVLLVPEDHRLARRRTVQLTDLAGEELVVPPANRPHRINLEQALRAADVPWTVAMEVEGWTITIHFASLGLGLAVVTGCVTPPPGLVAIPVKDLPDITYHVAYRAISKDDPRVAELLAAIRNGTAKHRRRRAESAV